MEARYFKRAQRDALIMDPTSHLNAGFYSLLTANIPLLLHAMSPISAVLNDLRYQFTFSEICAFNDGTHLSECFKHNLTYHIPITAKVQLDVQPLLEVGTKDPTVLATIRMPILYLPIPTGPSPLRCCALQDPDVHAQAIPSGIFVIDGHMHSCPGTKSMLNNTILLMEDKSSYVVHVRSSHEGNRTSTEGNPFRPTSSIKFIVNKTVKRGSFEGSIVCELPYSKKKVQIGLLAQAFGCSQRRFIDLVRCLSGSNYDQSIFRRFEIDIEYRTKNASSQKEAWDALSKLNLKEDGKQRQGCTVGINLLKTEIFPHLNVMYDRGDQKELYVMKLVYLALVTSMLILFSVNKIQETSRDLWQFASVLQPSFQIGSLVRQKLHEYKTQSVKLWRRALKTMFRKTPENQDVPCILKWWRFDRLSERIDGAIATGNFSRHGAPTAAKLGMTRTVTDNNPDGMVHQLQQIRASMRRTDSINTKPRNVPADGFFRLCEGSTPEGKMVGLVSALACMARITNDLEDPLSFVTLFEITFHEYLIPMFDVLLSPSSSSSHKIAIAAEEEEEEEENDDAKDQRNDDCPASDSTRLVHNLRFDGVKSSWYLFINHCGIPTHFITSEHLNAFISQFRQVRRDGCIPRCAFLRITHQPRQVRVICEGGQVIRPLVVLANLNRIQHAKMSFLEMIQAGIVEYVNTSEEQTACKIALSYDDLRYAISKNEHHGITHAEFDPASFLGLIGASVIFATCQPGPRTSYAIHQWKQSMCAGAKPYRGNILSTELTYNCAKLVHTRVAGMQACEKDGYGHLVMHAFLTDKKNQEDAFFNHKQAIERGLFHALTTRYYFSEILAPTAKTSERFEKPVNVFSKKENFSYDAIDDVTGLTKKNWYIPGGHPISAKTRIVKRTNDTIVALDNDQNQAKKHKSRDAYYRREVGVCTQPDESGITSSVDLLQTKNGIGMRSAVVTSRPMENGNKSTNDGANKGTNSENRSSKDMYYDEITGRIIDVISAPTAILSRNLMSTIHEGFIGHAITLNGDLKFGVDEQMYDGNMREKLKRAADVFVKAGKKRSGGAILRCGRTGKRLRSDVAELMIYSKPLLHLVKKKIQFRSRGPRHSQTRQPLTGRRKKGAPRFGELESAATTAQGASGVLVERLRDCSDPFEIFVCHKCCSLATGNKFLNYRWCQGCESRDSVYLVKIAFIFLYNLYERAAAGNLTKIHIRPHTFTRLNEPPTASFLK